MINVVYLVLIITTGSYGVAVEKIPQANMKQCQINLRGIQGHHRTLDRKNFSHAVRGHCVVGV